MIPLRRLLGTRHRACLAAVVVVLAPAVAIVEDAEQGTAQQGGTWTFGYTGEPQVFTVPAGVRQLSMVVVGGAGGQPDANVGPGGVSGATVVQFPVDPGDGARAAERAAVLGGRRGW